MKKHIMNVKNIKKYPKQKIAIIMLSIVSLLLVLGLAVGAYFISYIWKVQKDESNSRISTLILQAVDGLNRPVPIDAQTGKAFLPQVRLSLPISDNATVDELQYRYSPALNGNSEELSIVNSYGFIKARSSLISAQKSEETFNMANQLQACARGYQFLLNPNNERQRTLRFTKKLNDGRELYVYLDNGCNDINDDFENYLKQIESY